ncbi:hypothetical protein P879_07948 [Paragonimus westermani]|uniref:Uncharacterized protein n=1 Tax=Paragonimus westermani TaxID=34504 RepID=A0A8T0CY07_9TREM|nr:hypothetical protein P879_07948 [Paragonimus westermani]
MSSAFPEISIRMRVSEMLPTYLGLIADQWYLITFTLPLCIRGISFCC